MAWRKAASAATVVLVASAASLAGSRSDRPAYAQQAGLQFVQQWANGSSKDDPIVLDDQSAPIAQGSPMVATLDGAGPSVVVGDRAGGLYAYHLADGSPVAGWPVEFGLPIDSTPSQAPAGPGGPGDIFVGTGNEFEPSSGGYSALATDGAALWSADAVDPYASPSAEGVEAGLTVSNLNGHTAVFAGDLGQVASAFDASTGATRPGWPFFEGDSNFSTAASADLYGTGTDELVEGGASSQDLQGIALGQNYPAGGHVRILNGEGGLVCHYDTDQEVDSSPAVGAFLPGGQTGIVVGTGAYYAGATSTDLLMAFDTRCQPVWSARLDGLTSSSPALADVQGTGRLDVVEGTNSGPCQQQQSGCGSVWLLDAATGQTLWHTPVSGEVIGSVVTADLTGDGYQDLLVPTTFATDVVDGRTGAIVAQLTSSGFQNSPLVTDDPNGTIGITLAGYNGDNVGTISHYEIPGSNGALAVGPGSWPMFHHDPELSGVAPEAPLPAVSPCDVPSAAEYGYRMIASDGGVFSYGPPFCGSTGNIHLNKPIVGSATAPNTGGYWLVASDGGIFTFGGAGYYGSLGAIRLNQPIVGMAATPDGRGYWLVAADGGVFAFGDARYFGSMGGTKLSKPIVGMAATADGRGYWLVAADGGIFAFGEAPYRGSPSANPVPAPITGISEDQATGGYWLAGADGSVYAYDAPNLGAIPRGVKLTEPVVGLTSLQNGDGYWLVAADGGVFSFGAAGFRGSTGAIKLNRPIVSILGLTG